MEECSGEGVHGMQTDYQDLAKSSQCFWGSATALRCPGEVQSTALGAIARCREMMW